MTISCRVATRRSARLRACAAVCSACIWLASSSSGRAQEAAADALFQAGKDLAAKGQHREACPKFEASYKLDPTLGTLLNMADCHEKLGLVARAWAEWGKAVDVAKRSADTARTELAARRRRELDPRVPTLAITVAGSPAGLSIWTDDVQLEPAMLGVDLPVDPGAHAVTVRRGDQVLREVRVSVREGAHERVVVDLAGLDTPPPPPPASASPPAPSATAPSDGNRRVDAEETGSSPLRTTAYVVGGIGVATVLAAALLEAMALSRSSSAEEQCPGGLCTRAGIEDVDSARGLAEAGQWVGIGGLGLVGVGVLLWVLAPPSPRPASKPAPAVGLRIHPSPRGVGLVLGGSL